MDTSKANQLLGAAGRGRGPVLRTPENSPNRIVAGVTEYRDPGHNLKNVNRILVMKRSSYQQGAG